MVRTKTQATAGTVQVDKKKSTKKDKDPNAPKKARTSYIIFAGEEGKKIRQAHPEMSTAPVPCASAITPTSEQTNNQQFCVRSTGVCLSLGAGTFSTELPVDVKG